MTKCVLFEDDKKYEYNPNPKTGHFSPVPGVFHLCIEDDGPEDKG